jgi:PAS domain S-box-containing protein
VAEPAPLLVVDDDALSRLVLTRALEQAGLKYEAVGSGEAAIAWLTDNTASLVLLDLMMPPPDGYSVLRILRADERTRDVPVVVLTGLDAEEEVSRAFDMGADDFVRKPFKAAELVARIRSQLSLRAHVDALARREHDAKVVLELTQALASTLDFRNILYTVVRRIADVARVDRCSIVLVRDDGKVGYVVAASDDRELRDLPLELSKYPEIRKVLETGEPLVIDDARGHALFLDAVLPPASFRSLAILPILYEDRPLGVLFLRGRRPGATRDHELWVARTIASAMAIALRNARMMQTLRDQTRESTYARFEAERKIRALEPYADFFHSAAEGIAVVDAEGSVLFSNLRASEITGRTKDQLAAVQFGDLVVPDDRDAFGATLRSFAADRPSLTRDFTIVKPVAPSLGPSPHDPERWLESGRPSERGAPGGDDPAGDEGSRRPRPRRVSVVMASAQPRSPDRAILSLSFVRVSDADAILLSFRDVTADRSTAAELTKTKEYLERVIESSVDAIISADLKGNVLLFNRAAERCFGYMAKEVVNRMNVRDLYPPGGASMIMHMIKTGEHGGPGRLEAYTTDVLAADGQKVPVQVSAALILDQGVPIGSVGVMTDLRERLRMEASLTEAREELRQREKQALIAELAGAAAHELNQPLTSVLGYAEIMRRRVKAGEPVVRETEAIATEAERMAEIVRKIGKITKYETKAYVGEANIIDIDRSSEDPNRELT